MIFIGIALVVAVGLALLISADAGSLAYNCEIEVRYAAFSGPHAVDGEGQEAIGRGATPLRVAWRKVGPDITVGESAENCVCQRMQGDVGIR